MVIFLRIKMIAINNILVRISDELIEIRVEDSLTLIF